MCEREFLLIELNITFHLFKAKLCDRDEKEEC